MTISPDIFEKSPVLHATESPGHNHKYETPAQVLQLSDIEKDVILQMRKAYNLEVQALKDEIHWLEWSKDKLYSDYRSLNFWNEILVAALKDHNIMVPPYPFRILQVVNHHCSFVQRTETWIYM
jgi:hypothetical protein